MIVRALDANGDWIYGKGLEDYKNGNLAIAQTIVTRLKSFLGDCFFATNAGIDWFNLLGSKNELALNLAVSATILNTPNILSIEQLSIVLNSDRQITIKYKVKTTFGLVAATILQSASFFLNTEGGNTLTTEDGVPLRTE